MLCMVSLDPEDRTIFWLWVSSEVSFGPRWPSTSPNVLKEKWENFDLQWSSKNRINNLTFFGITQIFIPKSSTPSSLLLGVDICNSMSTTFKKLLTHNANLYMYKLPIGKPSPLFLSLAKKKKSRKKRTFKMIYKMQFWPILTSFFHHCMKHYAHVHVITNNFQNSQFIF